MTFLVHAPAAPLNRAIEHFYCPVGPMPFRWEYVMPGPAIDLKINFGDRVEARRGVSENWDAQASQGWCMGLWDEHHAVRWPSHTAFIGITFRPGGAYALFGIEAHELGNQIVALDALLGSFATEMRDRLGEAPDVQTRFAILEHMLTARLRDVSDVDRVTSAVNMLERSHGTVPISQLAVSSGVSHKHLVTLFNRIVGAPPKTLARIFRLQQLIASMDAVEPATWTHVAYDFDYCDQSHLNKDFKRLTGRTPAQYLAQRRHARAANLHHAKHWRLLPQG